MRVCVVGSGYVGLVSGIGLAELGHEVVCVDLDAARVAEINAGVPPLHEAGLAELVDKHVGSLLTASTDLAGAAAASRLTLICVGTPSRPDGSMDTTALEAAAREIGTALRKHTGAEAPVVVVKSTVVPGTTDTLVRGIVETASGRTAGVDLGIGSNPEFLTEGQAVADFLEPDRIVLGGDAVALAALRELYAGFEGVPVLETNARTAELVKYASNAMLAAAISFSNEIADLAEQIGDIDAHEVMHGVHLSRYLTSPAPGRAGLASFYEAGCGYGGSCLPKDVAALTDAGRREGLAMPLLQAVAEVNTGRPGRLVDAVRRELGSLEGRRITVLGLAFKQDTDDVRFSPAFPVLDLLVEAGAEVTAHDPVVGESVLAPYAGAVRHTHDLAEAVEGAEAVVLVTRWAQYEELPKLLDGADTLLVDGRRMLAANSVPRYAGIGLRTVR
ncbi:UDP-glucose/GDP-mannose dehydrogenase family protein [Pseudonocardia ailaonensis]|uniref:UDP-glucose 6-dehydrogenase n=1 Tax=Pseudonocardia ailaonensis TaxID=367279 RepID=A0ABN2NAX3_9PSEU